MNKATRVLETKVKPILKEIGPVKLNKTKIETAVVVTNTRKQPDNIQINLMNFKERLVGLNSLEVRELLGTPKFKRNEHPASIWQYQSTVCLVDIFLFTQKNALTVDHVEVRSKNIQKVDEKICFASILTTPPIINSLKNNVN